MCLFVEKINLAHYRRNEKVLKTVVHSLYVKSYFNYAVRVHLDTGGSHIRRVVPIMCCYSSSILRCSLFSVQFSSVQSLSPALTLRLHGLQLRQASLSITNSQSLL